MAAKENGTASVVIVIKLINGVHQGGQWELCVKSEEDKSEGHLNHSLYGETQRYGCIFLSLLKTEQE